MSCCLPKPSYCQSQCYLLLIGPPEQTYVILKSMYRHFLRKKCIKFSPTFGLVVFVEASMCWCFLFFLKSFPYRSLNVPLTTVPVFAVHCVCLLYQIRFLETIIQDNNIHHNIQRAVHFPKRTYCSRFVQSYRGFVHVIAGNILPGYLTGAGVIILIPL